MNENPNSRNSEEIQELIIQFNRLKSGKSHSFIDEDSFEQIIDYFDEQEDYSMALQATEFAIEQYPYSSTLLIRKADLLITTKKYQESLEVLEQASLLSSNDINIYILKIDALLALDEHEKAVQVLKEGLLIFEGNERIELLFELADVYDDYEDFEKVFDCIKAILEDDPNNEEALYKICFWADFTGRLEESIKLHNKILEDFPYNELAWFNLATAYQGLRLYEKAVDAYLYALAIDDKFEYAYRNIADAYIHLRKYKDAIEALQRVLELSRPEEVIYEAIGHCFDKLKNPAQARFYFRKACHLNPQDSRLHYKIAQTYIQQELWESAMKPLTIALSIHRLQPEYNLAMGDCLKNLGNYKQAIEFYFLVTHNRPKNKKGWMALIDCMLKAGILSEAHDVIELALKNTNDKPIFYFYKSAVFFALGKQRKAIQSLETALQKDARLVKTLLQINPKLLQNPQVVDLIAKYKNGKKKNG